MATGFQPDDEVVVTFTAEADGQAFVAVSERWRLPTLAAMMD